MPEDLAHSVALVKEKMSIAGKMAVSLQAAPAASRGLNGEDPSPSPGLSHRMGEGQEGLHDPLIKRMVRR